MRTHMQTAWIEQITDFIFLPPSTEDLKLLPADIIFIPGGSMAGQAEKAAALWNTMQAAKNTGEPETRLLPAGKYGVGQGKFRGAEENDQDRYPGPYATEWAFLTDVLIQNGVNPAVILREDQSGYTLQNALFSRKVTDAAGLEIKNGVIVCKSFHARRCLTFYQIAFPNAALRVETVDWTDRETGISIRRDNWFYTETGIRRVMGELERCGSQCADPMIRLRQNAEGWQESGDTNESHTARL